MSILDALDLPDMPDGPRACPKGASRLDERIVAARNEKILEAACKKTVWKRDESTCRCCHCRVVKALELTPKRGETHHIVARADWAVRFDSRNRVLVCATCHEAIEHNKILIVGTARQMFTAENGKSYLNSDKPIKFTKATT